MFYSFEHDCAMLNHPRVRRYGLVSQWIPIHIIMGLKAHLNFTALSTKQ